MKKIGLIFLLAIMIVMTGCGDKEIKPLDTRLSGGDELSFNFNIDDFIDQYNMYYGEEYLLPSDGDSQYVFTEDEEIRTLPVMTITSSEDGTVDSINLIFDWHSLSDALLEKYSDMCFYSLRTFLPEMTDEELNDLCFKIIYAGYDNPVSGDMDEPYAIYYSGNTGITTRFAMGQSQQISIIPVTEEILAEYDAKGVKLAEIEK